MTTVLVSTVGGASGSRAAAAALTCAGSEPDRAGLLIDLGDGRAPRPSLIATSGARRLEERLAAHMPEARVASRGSICHLGLGAEESGVAQIPAALPLVRDSIAVVHLLPHLLQPVLEETRVGATGALLLADLATDRALTALAVRDLLDRGIRTTVLKRPLGWLAARRALLGALPSRTSALPSRLSERLLKADDRKFRQCYDRRGGSEGDRKERQPEGKRGGPAQKARPDEGTQGGPQHASGDGL